MKFSDLLVGDAFACRFGILKKEGAGHALHIDSHGLSSSINSAHSVVFLPSVKIIMESEYKEILKECKRIGLSIKIQQLVESYLKRQGVFAETEPVNMHYPARLAATVDMIEAIEHQHDALLAGETHDDFTEEEVQTALQVFKDALDMLELTRKQIRSKIF